MRPPAPGQVSGATPRFLPSAARISMDSAFWSRRGYGRSHGSLREPVVGPEAHDVALLLSR